MEKQFSTMSMEMIEKEIKKLEDVSRNLSQQEKLMLFALTTEHDARLKEMMVSEEEKLRKLIEQIGYLFQEYQKVEFESIRSDVLVPMLLRFYHQQKDVAQLTNRLIDDRQKKK